MRASAVGVTVASAAGLLLLAGGCGSCGASSLEVQGPTPYVRCLAADPPDVRTWEVGALELTIREGGELRIEGLEAPVRIAAFAGPAPGAGSLDEAMAALRARAPDLLVDSRNLL